MSKIKRRGFIALILAFVMCSSLFVGCGKEYKYNHEYLFGLCDPSGSLGGGVDKAITNEWLGDVASVMGVKSFRLWVSLDALFSVDKNNELSFKAGYLAKVHDYVDNLKRGGVENFLFLNTCYIYPYGSPMSGYDIPDVNEDEEEYLDFLKINAKAYGMAAREFPEIKNWETGNEPDLSGAGMHKHGYIGAIDVQPYLFADEELISIICDLSWYVRKELKAVSKDNRVALPGLSLYLDYDNDFFEGIYTAIESKTLPFGTEFSDTDPDNYFDILDWHPYTDNNKYSGSPYFLDLPDEEWDEWADRQIKRHEIAARHGDAEKPAYFSEFGYTDWGKENYLGDYNGIYQNNIANNYEKALDIIRSRMPWVEVVFCFRATTLVYQKASPNGESAEENFGLFYNQDDDTYGGKAKPAAIKLAEYFGDSGSEHYHDFDWLENKYSKVI